MASYNHQNNNNNKLERLAPEVNRILFVKNLPFKITSDDLYDLFGKYGAIRQLRIGNANDTRGTALVVYEDIYDAKNACEHLSGFNLMGRYLTLLYYQPAKLQKKLTLRKQEEEIQLLKQKYNIQS